MLVPQPIAQPERNPPGGEGRYSQRQREPLRTTPCPQADQAISTWLSAGGARESVADGCEVLSCIRTESNPCLGRCKGTGENPPYLKNQLG